MSPAVQPIFIGSYNVSVRGVEVVPPTDLSKLELENKYHVVSLSNGDGQTPLPNRPAKYKRNN